MELEELLCAVRQNAASKEQCKDGTCAESDAVLPKEVSCGIREVSQM